MGQEASRYQEDAAPVVPGSSSTRDGAHRAHSRRHRKRTSEAASEDASDRVYSDRNLKAPSKLECVTREEKERSHSSRDILTAPIERGRTIDSHQSTGFSAMTTAGTTETLGATPNTAAPGDRKLKKRKRRTTEAPEPANEALGTNNTSSNKAREGSSKTWTNFIEDSTSRPRHDEGSNVKRDDSQGQPQRDTKTSVQDVQDMHNLILSLPDATSTVLNPSSVKLEGKKALSAEKTTPRNLLSPSGEAAAPTEDSVNLFSGDHHAILEKTRPDVTENTAEQDRLKAEKIKRKEEKRQRKEAKQLRRLQRNLEREEDVHGGLHEAPTTSLKSADRELHQAVSDVPAPDIQDDNEPETHAFAAKPSPAAPSEEVARETSTMQHGKAFEDATEPLKRKKRKKRIGDAARNANASYTDLPVDVGLKEESAFSDLTPREKRIEKTLFEAFSQNETSASEAEDHVPKIEGGKKEGEKKGEKKKKKKREKKEKEAAAEVGIVKEYAGVGKNMGKDIVALGVPKRPHRKETRSAQLGDGLPQTKRDANPPLDGVGEKLDAMETTSRESEKKKTKKRTKDRKAIGAAVEDAPSAEMVSMETTALEDTITADTVSGDGIDERSPTGHEATRIYGAEQKTTHERNNKAVENGLGAETVGEEKVVQEAAINLSRISEDRVQERRLTGKETTNVSGPKKRKRKREAIAATSELSGKQGALRQRVHEDERVDQVSTSDNILRTKIEAEETMALSVTKKPKRKIVRKYASDPVFAGQSDTPHNIEEHVDLNHEGLPLDAVPYIAVDRTDAVGEQVIPPDAMILDAKLLDAQMLDSKTHKRKRKRATDIKATEEGIMVSNDVDGNSTRETRKRKSKTMYIALSTDRHGEEKLGDDPSTETTVVTEYHTGRKAQVLPPKAGAETNGEVNLLPTSNEQLLLGGQFYGPTNHDREVVAKEEVASKKRKHKKQKRQENAPVDDVLDPDVAEDHVVRRSVLGVEQPRFYGEKEVLDEGTLRPPSRDSGRKPKKKQRKNQGLKPTGGVIVKEAGEQAHATSTDDLDALRSSPEAGSSAIQAHRGTSVELGSPTRSDLKMLAAYDERPESRATASPPRRASTEPEMSEPSDNDSIADSQQDIGCDEGASIIPDTDSGPPESPQADGPAARIDAQRINNSPIAEMPQYAEADQTKDASTSEGEVDIEEAERPGPSMETLWKGKWQTQETSIGGSGAGEPQASEAEEPIIQTLDPDEADSEVSEVQKAQHEAAESHAVILGNAGSSDTQVDEVYNLENAEDSGSATHHAEVNDPPEAEAKAMTIEASEQGKIVDKQRTDSTEQEPWITRVGEPNAHLVEKLPRDAMADASVITPHTLHNADATSSLRSLIPPIQSESQRSAQHSDGKEVMAADISESTLPQPVNKVDALQAETAAMRKTVLQQISEISIVLDDGDDSTQVSDQGSGCWAEDMREVFLSTARDILNEQSKNKAIPVTRKLLRCITDGNPSFDEFLTELKKNGIKLDRNTFKKRMLKAVPGSHVHDLIPQRNSSPEKTRNPAFEVASSGCGLPSEERPAFGQPLDAIKDVVHPSNNRRNSLISDSARRDNKRKDEALNHIAGQLLLDPSKGILLCIEQYLVQEVFKTVGSSSIDLTLSRCDQDGKADSTKTSPLPCSVEACDIGSHGHAVTIAQSRVSAESPRSPQPYAETVDSADSVIFGKSVATPDLDGHLLVDDNVAENHINEAQQVRAEQLVLHNQPRDCPKCAEVHRLFYNPEQGWICEACIAKGWLEKPAKPGDGKCQVCGEAVSVWRFCKDSKRWCCRKRKCLDDWKEQDAVVPGCSAGSSKDKQTAPRCRRPRESHLCKEDVDCAGSGSRTCGQRLNIDGVAV